MNQSLKKRAAAAQTAGLRSCWKIRQRVHTEDAAVNNYPSLTEKGRSAAAAAATDGGREAQRF